MLMIRLQRTGRNKTATYRLVLLEKSRGPKSSDIIEYLGSYDPSKDKGKQVFKGDRIKERIAKGAQVSPTVFNLLISQGIIEGKKINALPKKSPTKKRKAPADEPKDESATTPETAKTEEAVSAPTENPQPEVEEKPAE